MAHTQYDLFQNILCIGTTQFDCTMRTLKKVLIVLSSLGFLLVMIGLITPGWVLFDADINEMAALQMKKMSPQVQQQYKVSSLASLTRASGSPTPHVFCIFE